MHHGHKQFGDGRSFQESDLTSGTGGVLYPLASDPEKSHLPELFSNTEQAKLTQGQTSQ